MKINWFSPLLPTKTDIAHYTSRVLSDLQKQAEITLWTDEKIWISELEQQANVRWYDPDCFPSEDIERADINIYNIGNNAKFHGSIWKVSCQHPGIVVIHDINLHYLFTTLFPKYFEPGSDRDSYAAIMQQTHGTMCQQDIENLFLNKLTWSTISERYPLTFAALKNALGVIVHNQEAFATFEQEQRWPVLYTPLPYPSTPLHPVNKYSQLKQTPYRLIVFGHLGGEHRRVQVVLEALSMLSEKSCFHLDIYGELWDENYISGLVQKFGLKDLVTLNGWVDETQLDSALANADLAINLRYPTGGEASGSQLRIWRHALPALVTRIGWYASLPESVVAFVRHERELEDIQQQLRSFLANPAKFAEMGKKGQQILAEEHSPALYAQRVVEFSKNVKNSQSNFLVAVPPRVSVIIPTYNCARYIQQAVESVLNQTYTDCEIIVVDDGSTDSTQQVLQRYRSRIRYVRYEHNQGVSVARNRGIEMARGFFIAFLDADDWFLPDKLAAQVAYFDANPSKGIVNSGFRKVNDRGEMIGDVKPWKYAPHLDLETWVKSKPILLSAMMFHRNWLNWVGGFDTRFECAEDVNLLLRLSLINCQADWLHQVTVCYRQHHHQSSQNTPKLAKSFEVVLTNFFEISDLPASIHSLKNQYLYQNFVWLAYHLYSNGHGSLMAQYLEKSLDYSQKSKIEAIADWVDRFSSYALDGDSSFSAYDFSSLSDWKKLMVSLLFNEVPTHRHQ